MSGLYFSLPSPIYGRGAGGEGEAKSSMFALRAYPLTSPLPQAGEGTLP